MICETRSIGGLLEVWAEVNANPTSLDTVDEALRTLRERTLVRAGLDSHRPNRRVLAVVWSRIVTLEPGTRWY